MPMPHGNCLKMSGMPWRSITLQGQQGPRCSYHHRGSHLIIMGTIADWQMPHHLCYYYVVPLFHCNGWGHVWGYRPSRHDYRSRAITAKSVYDALIMGDAFGGAPIVWVRSPMRLMRTAANLTIPSKSHRRCPATRRYSKAIEGIGFNVTKFMG